MDSRLGNRIRSIDLRCILSMFLDIWLGMTQGTTIAFAHWREQFSSGICWIIRLFGTPIDPGDSRRSEPLNVLSGTRREALYRPSRKESKMSTQICVVCGKTVNGYRDGMNCNDCHQWFCDDHYDHNRNLMKECPHPEPGSEMDEEVDQDSSEETAEPASPPPDMEILSHDALTSRVWFEPEHIIIKVSHKREEGGHILYTNLVMTHDEFSQVAERWRIRTQKPTETEQTDEAAA